ncbi:MAG: sigma-70 family RNA polymerase sigma factor, partial [Muribaculaceae bacterium]|nr:sigma-70 family RNA polymerase sigma factor [Muribaculaceae bacterium]
YESVKAIIDSRLSEREKAVITMRDTMGMDFGDIAEELGITEANTRMILSRARKTVREIYLSSKK